MLQALLRGKLSYVQENAEDILTSSVFGLLSYLPPDEGLIPLLRLAQRKDSRRVEWLLGPLQILQIEFWPTYRDGPDGWLEPDVMIWVQDANGQKHLVLIEVKLWSGKSVVQRQDASSLGDQLAREWSLLARLCEHGDAIPLLLFVTADRLYPSIEVQESEQEYSSKLPTLSATYPFTCSWISWLQVTSAFEASESRALRDIALSCRKLDLVPFEGISPIAPTGRLWSFAEGVDQYSFMMTPIPIEWRFQ